MIKFSHSKDEQISPTSVLPTIMIPTLLATASEMNPTAVITDGETLKNHTLDASFSADGTLASIPPIPGTEVYKIYELAL